MGSIRIKSNRKNQLGLFGASLVGFFYVLQFVVKDFLGRKYIAFTLEGIFLVFLLMLTVELAICMIRAKDSLIIDDDGFVDYSLITGVGKVAWHEVKAINIINFVSAPYIAIWLYDERSVRLRVSGVRRVILWLNARACTAPIIIGNKGAKESIQEIEMLLREKFDAYQIRTGLA